MLTPLPSDSESISTSYNPTSKETTSVLTLSSVSTAKDGINYRCTMVTSDTTLVSSALLYVNASKFQFVVIVSIIFVCII